VAKKKGKKSVPRLRGDKVIYSFESMYVPRLRGDEPYSVVAGTNLILSQI